jgi:hypothetical protein
MYKFIIYDHPHECKFSQVGGWLNVLKKVTGASKKSKHNVTAVL